MNTRSRRRRREPDHRSRPVVAFRAARQWVRLGWHIQQAWLGYSEAHADEAREIGGDLASEVRFTAPANRSQSVRRFVQDALMEWRSSYARAAAKGRRALPEEAARLLSHRGNNPAQTLWGGAFEEACADFA